MCKLCLMPHKLFSILSVSHCHHILPSKPNSYWMLKLRWLKFHWDLDWQLSGKWFHHHYRSIKDLVCSKLYLLVLYPDYTNRIIVQAWIKASIDRSSPLHYCTCSALQKSSIPVYLELLGDWGLLTDQSQPPPPMWAQVLVWCQPQSWHFRRKMSVSALIKASRSSETFPENLYCNAELRGAAAHCVSCQSQLCVSNNVTILTAVLWINLVSSD